MTPPPRLLPDALLPSLSTTNGDSLARPLLAAHALCVHGPQPLRKLVRAVASRTVARALPELVARYPDGRCFMVPAGDPQYSSVFFFGEWEPGETAAVRELLRPGDFVVDVGANYGWFTLLMASCVGHTGSVWAVEPVSSIRAALERNVALNPAGQVTILPWLLGAAPGTGTVHIFHGLSHLHASVATLGRRDFTEEHVPMFRLDDLCDTAPATPALVKLDCEGSELNVLTGATGLLSGAQPPIWTVEVNYETSAAFGYAPHEIIELLREHGDYEVFRVCRDRLVAEAVPAQAPHGATWVCVPATSAARVDTLPSA